MLTVLHATERDVPKGRERIDWKLVTDLPIRSRNEAIEKLSWYAMRWKIETFHKILKSGFKAEEVRLRTAERIVNLIALLCLLSWRVLSPHQPLHESSGHWPRSRPNMLRPRMKAPKFSIDR
jgi:hypothetical protein